ncbi:TetR/AcrR family transcriptional regulator [Mycolicibacterium litorale]|uniref:TetR/AcrR family transcriptional regulator n=1 Tax=Mycolicibacterium litorale TaxID=758802 RepID=UPI003CEF97D3
MDPAGGPAERTAPVRGRRRDPRTRQAILSATRTLLIRDGYDQVTIEAVARQAGVSRPTVYRRWPSKAHVVFEAAFHGDQTVEILDSTGDFAADLRRFLYAVMQFWREPVVYAAALGILAERHRDPRLRIRAQQLLDEATQARFTALVRDGIEQGLVAPGMDGQSLYDTLVGSTFYAVHVRDITDATDIDAFVTHLCSLALQGATARHQEPR